MTNLPVKNCANCVARFSTIWIFHAWKIQKYANYTYSFDIIWKFMLDKIEKTENVPIVSAHWLVFTYFVLVLNDQLICGAHLGHYNQGRGRGWENLKTHLNYRNPLIMALKFNGVRRHRSFRFQSNMSNWMYIKACDNSWGSCMCERIN